MYICLDCGRIFEESSHFTDKHGLDSGPYEEYDGCPQCGGAYVEAHRCDCCGEYIVDTYIKLESGERICSECYTTHELGEE